MPLLMDPILLLISDSYGLKNWNKNEKICNIYLQKRIEMLLYVYNK